jgi:hypothetical protein
VAISREQASIYLALEGHLPETFLIERIFGLSRAEAERVAAELERQSVEANPAVRSMKIAGRRKQLRRRYGMAQVEDEEIILGQGFSAAARLSQLHAQQQPQPEMPRGIAINLGELLSNIFGGQGGVSFGFGPPPGPPPPSEQDRPSNFSVEDLLRGNFGKEEEDGSEDGE